MPSAIAQRFMPPSRSNVGKAMQVLASVFVPSRAATLLAHAAGGLGDLALHAFVPVVVTGESINRAGGIEGSNDIVSRYIPFVNELEQYFGAAKEQVTALAEGAAPYYQFSSYQDELRAAKAEHEPFAAAMGYFGRRPPAVRLRCHRRERARHAAAELADKYPTGFKMSQEFTNEDAINAQALVDLSNKEDRSEAEDRILELVQNVEADRYLGELKGFDSQMIGAMTAHNLRRLAKGYAGDRRFLELWDRFFAREYGPISRAA